MTLEHVRRASLRSSCGHRERYIHEMFRVWNCVFIQSRVSAGMTSRILKGGCCPCEIDLSRLTYGVMLMLGMAGPAVAQDSGVGALSASAASAYPFAAIDRPGICSRYERSGVDSETAAAGPASA